MRLIDADALIGGIKENNLGEWYVGRIDGKSEEVIPTDTVYKIIDSAPSIEPKRGEWKRRIVDNGFNADWVCSECGYRVKADFTDYNFCPNCGADMRERKESE